MFTNLLVLTMLSCVATNNTQESDSSPEVTNEAAESLDRMIETSEAMLENMKLMNHKLELIFRAVTNCSTDQECEAEHTRLQEQIDARAK